MCSSGFPVSFAPFAPRAFRDAEPLSFTTSPCGIPDNVSVHSPICPLAFPCIPHAFRQAIYPLFVIRLLLKQQTRDNTRIEFHIRKTEKQKLNALSFPVFLSLKIQLINVLCVLIICQLFFYKGASLSARYCKSKSEKYPLPFRAFAL